MIFSIADKITTRNALEGMTVFRFGRQWWDMDLLAVIDTGHN
jgi:hypothetical protein